jgi:hypothetical protein
MSDNGTIPLIIAKKNNNGIGGKISTTNIISANKISVVCQGDGGSGMAYFQNEQFAGTSAIKILKPKFKINEEIGIFISKVMSLV